MTRFLALSLACAVGLAARANAQGMISGAKAVAGRAAVAANAHTAAEQNPNGTQAPATNGAQAAKTTPVTAAAAKTTAVPAAGAKTTPIAPAAAPVAAKTTPLAAPATTGKAATATTVAVKPGAKVIPAKAAPVAAPAVTSDTGARSISVTQRGIKGEVSLNREVFSYDAGGRRDPFVSLLRNGDLRPMVSDLRLMVVLYDPTGRNSIAIMNDLSTKEQYRVRVGVTLGRMRVAQIEPKQVVFTIEEIGFSRQEVLALGDSSTARTQ